jgi:hypothetical protein
MSILRDLLDVLEWGIFGFPILIDFPEIHKCRRFYRPTLKVGKAGLGAVYTCSNSCTIPRTISCTICLQTR